MRAKIQKRVSIRVSSLIIFFQKIISKTLK
nr:MAG TPA: hypothetical protein [Caudoviricetes sp.]